MHEETIRDPGGERYQNIKTLCALSEQAEMGIELHSVAGGDSGGPK